MRKLRIESIKACFGPLLSVFGVFLLVLGGCGPAEPYPVAELPVHKVQTPEPSDQPVEFLLARALELRVLTEANELIGGKSHRQPVAIHEVGGGTSSAKAYKPKIDGHQITYLRPLHFKDSSSPNLSERNELFFVWSDEVSGLPSRGVSGESRTERIIYSIVRHRVFNGQNLWTDPGQARFPIYDSENHRWFISISDLVGSDYSKMNTLSEAEAHVVTLDLLFSDSVQRRIEVRFRIRNSK